MLRRFAGVLLLAAVLAVVLLVLAPRLGSTTPALTIGDGSWPTYQGSPSHNAVVEAPDPHANWLIRLGDRINGGIAAVDGMLYVDSFDRKLYAIDQRTGQIRWSAQADNILMSTPVVHDGLVIVGSGKDGFLKPDDPSSQVWGRNEGDDLYAFSTADGHLVWKVHTQGQNMPSPAIDGDAVIFANGDGHAYARDLKTGNERWTVPLPGIATMASMTLHDGVAFVSTCHNAPYTCETRAIDVSDGRTRWSNEYGGSDCTPTVDRGLVFVNETSNETKRFHTGGTTTVAAINERTGRTVWTRTFDAGPFTYIASSERQIAGTAHGGVLYQPIGNRAMVVAFDERSGRVLWIAHTSANVKMSPVVKGDSVYFGDTAGVLYDVNRKSGRIEHTSSFLQPFSTSPPVIVGNTLFIACGPMVVAMPLSDV
jgi:outer membrane protein assembly factor BamB